MTRTDDGDGFWAIAMVDEVGEQHRLWDDVSDDEGEGDFGGKTKTITYRIPDFNNPSPTTTVLKLRPMPATEGVWSPVGADAWYASALLACLLLYNEPLQSRNKDGSLSSIPHPMTSAVAAKQSRSEGTRNVILELGSGAVGLSGFVCALALNRELTKESQSDCGSSKWKVVLTDNDPHVLAQLQANLDDNFSVSATSMVDVSVTAWDWKDEKPDNGLFPEDDVVLVIGSELVYTLDTANACVHILRRLLNHYPDAEIWIVQVSDRYGWWDIVVPKLQQEDIRVESISILSDIHDMGNNMIPMGGTLDRYAYGAFRIYCNPS